MAGRVGASRPRVNVQPYDTDGDDVYDSAWVIMGAEESKAMGEGSIEEEVEPEDLGKNMWYYTFDLLNPEVVMQGGMLNQPAVDPETGTFFQLLEDDLKTRSTRPRSPAASPTFRSRSTRWRQRRLGGPDRQAGHPQPGRPG